MKMNINKACDLKSISVFPPSLRRRSSVGPPEPQASQQQLRSQQSQQSFSQGPSSQRGCFSQMTQSSVEELLINDQNWLGRRVMSAWRVGDIVHALEGWEEHDCGNTRNFFRLQAIWEAALRHGFRPILLPSSHL